MRKLGLLIASLFLLSCSGDKDNSEPPAPLTKIDQALRVIVDWKTDTGAGIETASYNMRPLLVQDQIFSVDTSGLVKSIDTESGKVNWSSKTGIQAITGLAGTAAVILASSRNGDLNTYDILEDDLELRWSARLKGEIRALPLIAGHQVSLYQRLTITGKRQCRHATRYCPLNTPVVKRKCG